MARDEAVPVRVEIVVYISGHILTFDERGNARGVRLDGSPGEPGTAALEAMIRGTVDTLMARAMRRANLMLARVYPVHQDE